MKQFDFLILGSGSAGLSFALKVAPHGHVAIVTKNYFGKTRLMDNAGF
jgi:L-aspartate oxidase